MSYFNYFATDLDADAFYLPYAMWYVEYNTLLWMSIEDYYCVAFVFFPLSRTIFDWRTPTAYIFAFLFQSLVTAYAVIVGSVLLIHFSRTIWLFVAFVDDIKIDMSALDAHKRNKISDNKLYEYLCDIIKFRIEIKQLS